MVDIKKAQARAARRQSAERAVLIAAYREGLGLSCITIICDAEGARISATASDSSELDAERDTQTRLWCRRGEDGKRVAAAATARLRRLKSGENARSPTVPIDKDSSLLLQARDAVLAAAQRLNVALQSDDEIAKEALLVIAHVDAGIQKLRQSGGLKPVNKAYQEYRLERKACGAPAKCYDDWMLEYRANLVRQAAQTLRDI
jgi:hypothetical protein